MTLCAIAIFTVAAARAEDNDPAPDYDRMPVLLLHDRESTPESYALLVNHLMDIGYPREFVLGPSLPLDSKGSRRIAERVVAPAVEQLLAQANRTARRAGWKAVEHEKVVIVAHGLGALSGRWYAAKVRPDRVRLWIGLAGANHGSNALCRSFDAGAHDSCPAFGRSARLSPVQTALNGTYDAPLDETPYGFGVDAQGVPSVRPTPDRGIGYFTLRLPFDERITPENSSELDGAGGLRLVAPLRPTIKETSSGNFLYDTTIADIRGAPEIDHQTMPDHPDVHRFVAAVLTARWLWEP